MKALLSSIVVLVLPAVAAAQTCREVVRDSSGRIVQTVESRKEAGGTRKRGNLLEILTV
jgi:hypothetical protein